MQDKVLKILEFNKVIHLLSSHCCSSLGQELADNLTPNGKLEDVKLHQHETSQAVSMIIAKGCPSFGGLKDIRYSLIKAEKGSVLTPKELMGMADSLRCSRNLKAYHQSSNVLDGHKIKTQHCRYDILDQLFENLYVNKKIEEKILSCIINEEEISDTASPALHSIRRGIFDAEQKIKDKLNGIIHSSHYQKYLQENIVTIRSGRYVIPVKQEYRNEISGLVHDSSSSGATLFIEPMAVVEANNAIKQLKIKENLEIERILAELTAFVSEIRSELAEGIELLGKLDFIFAKAHLSLDMNAVQPKLNNNGIFNLKKARHPLLNKESVVPIDIWCGEQFNSLIITGPNTGGKTVTLKTVGLLTLMAQAGLHIPAAEDSEINVFQKIFADIGDEQSIEQSLSTFSSHMVNIVDILGHVDSNTLVLLDELGAGTDPVEGAALAMAILETLSMKNARTIATTHYSELKSFAIRNGGHENACCEFNVETLRPTYKLLIGVPGRSNAFAISNRLGLQEDIIERARSFISSENTRFEDIIAQVEKNKIAAEAQLHEIESIKENYQKLKCELEIKEQQLAEQKNKLLKEAKIEARTIIEQAKNDADRILEEIQRLSEEDSSERNKKAEGLKNILRKKLKESESSLAVPLFTPSNNRSSHHFKIGDSVYILSLKQEGTVLSEPDENKNILVQAGIIKLKLHSSLLQPVKHDKVTVNSSGISKIASNKDRQVSLELSVRGQTLDEALANVDRYLNDVSLAGLKTVTIIHGKGTGILRNGVHQYLKSHPMVKSYRLGKFGEGEHGVTIVELKE